MKHTKSLGLDALGWLSSYLPEGDAAETFPRFLGGGATAPTAGVLHVRKMWLPNGRYNTIKLAEAGTAPSVVANTFVGIYDDSTGALLAQTAEFSASLAANALITIALTTTLVINDPAGGRDVWFGLLIGSATGMPTFVTQAPSQTYQLTDPSLGAPLAGRHNTTGLTSLPATFVYNGSNVLALYGMVLGV